MSEFERERKLEILNTILANFREFRKDNISINLREFEHDNDADVVHNYKIIIECLDTISESIGDMQNHIIADEFSPHERSYESSDYYDDYYERAA